VQITANNANESAPDGICTGGGEPEGEGFGRMLIEEIEKILPKLYTDLLFIME
jgi:hypothetical protein